MLLCTNIKQLLICGISELLLLHIHSIKQGFHGSFFCLSEIDKGQQFACQNILFMYFKLRGREIFRFISREDNLAALNRISKLK